MINPTDEQLKIINNTDNAVIIAIPGSGKTYVLSEKIRKVLKSLVEFKGVIAISYTNKASEELKKRCLKGSINKKSSFFGTIDSFYLSEIIIPFGKQVFGMPYSMIITCKISELKDFEQDYFHEQKDLNELDKFIDMLKQFFLRGMIILEYIGFLANFIFDNSKSCKNYLKARYTHLMIDEYQDSGEEQHNLFLKFLSLDICCIAVGDADQSIYGFSGKDPKFLFELSQNNLFNFFSLTFNHRSHKSIIDYSSALLRIDANAYNQDVRIFEKNIDGHQHNIAHWLNSSILDFASYFNVGDLSNIAILFRNNYTGSMINDSLDISRKYYTTTKLDSDFNLISNIFKRLLFLIFDTNVSKIELFEELLGGDISTRKAKDLLKIIFELELLLKNRIENLNEIIKYFIDVSQIVFPNIKYENSIEILKEILLSDELLNSFKPPKKNEVQLMTIHKSKGLEFDLVFHLDLYKWIFPIFNSEYQQELNLHYVAITRAKKGCILCTSTKRYNSNKEIKNANNSEFLYLNNTKNLRVKSNF